MFGTDHIEPDSSYSGQVADTRGSGLRRRSLRWSATVALVVVAAVGLAALVGWRVVAAEVRGDVTVSWSGPIDCDGTTVRSVPRTDGVGRMTLVPVRRGMRCTLPVQVTNASGFAVTVTRMRLPLMGPEGGVTVQVRRLEGREPLKPQSVDAVFRLDEVVQPGATYEVDLVLGFRAPPEGCSSPRVTTIYADFPRVTVQALGRPGLVRSDRTVGFRGTADTDCSAG